MKVLVCNEWTSSNIGDKTIDYVVSNVLGMSLPENEDNIIVHLGISLHTSEVMIDKYNGRKYVKSQYIKSPHYVATLKERLAFKLLHRINNSESYWITHKRRLRDFNLKSGNQDYDYLFIGGGNLIMDYIGFYATIGNILKNVHYKHLYFIGVGVDDLTHCDEARKKYQQILDNYAINRIYVRDTKSYNNLFKNFNVHSEVKVLADPVFSIHSIYRKARSSDLSPIVMSFMNLEDYCKNMKIPNDANNAKMYMDSLSKILDNYREEEIILLPNSKVDGSFMRSLIEYYKKNNPNTESKITLFSYPAYTDSSNNYEIMAEYLKILSSAKKVVSNRMHALIIATSYGIPIEVSNHTPKLDGFLEYVSFTNITSNNVRKEYLDELRRIMK